MIKLFIDTNKYLDFYRYKEENREILDKLALSDNIIITEQVIREFKRNRVTELNSLLDKILAKEKQFTNNMCNIEPMGIFSDRITEINKKNSKFIDQIKNSFRPIEDEIRNMINDDRNDSVLDTFNKIISNDSTIFIEDDEEVYNLAIKRNNLGGVPRSEKNGFKSLTVCDEYIWESLLSTSDYDLVFVTKDSTYLDNKNILSEEYKTKTGNNIFFIKYVSEALKIIGEKISKEAIEKEQQEQNALELLDDLRRATGINTDELDEILLSLTETEEQVIKLRFGLVDGIRRTLEEVSLIFGISREDARKIEAKALRKMRKNYGYDILSTEKDE